MQSLIYKQSECPSSFLKLVHGERWIENLSGSAVHIFMVWGKTPNVEGATLRNSCVRDFSLFAVLVFSTAGVLGNWLSVKSVVVSFWPSVVVMTNYSTSTYPSFYIATLFPPFSLSISKTWLHFSAGAPLLGFYQRYLYFPKFLF